MSIKRRNSETENKTFYGFKYSDVQATMNRKMPLVIEDVNALVDELMSSCGAEYVCHDELDDNADGNRQ